MDLLQTYKNMFKYNKNITFTSVTAITKYALEVTEEKWLQRLGHINRMPGNRLPQRIMKCEPDTT